MHSRSLGSTGIDVSVLGMGSSPFRHGTPRSCGDLLAAATDLGITYYDTARSYINGEEAVAYLSQEHKKSLVIATKTGSRGGPFCLEDLVTSLRTMKREWIDVWMTHMLRTEEEYEQCLALGGFCDIAAAAKEAGLIRTYGVSLHAPTPLIVRAIEERAFEVVMFQFNLIGRETVFGSSIPSYRDQVLPRAAATGTGVVAMKVLAGGELSHGAPRLASLGGEAEGRSVIANAIRYVAMHPHISTAVVGFANARQLAAGVRAVEGVRDDLAEFSRLTRRVEEIDRRECSRCGACVDICPEAIEIAKVMRLYDQKRFFGMEAMARQRYSTLAVNGSNCQHCQECQKVCPEPIDIGTLLAGAHDALAAAALSVRAAGD